MSGWSLDPSNMVSALLFVEKVAGRSARKSLNRAALHTVIGSGSYPGAMQLTPKASRGDIVAIPMSKLRGYVVSQAKKKGQWPLTSAEVNLRAQKERRRRLRSIGYAAYAGYSNAAKALGGKGIKGVHDGFAHSEAAHGKGKKATDNDLLAEIVNTAPAIERIGPAALQQAVDNAAKDLVDYGTKKLNKELQKVRP